MADEMQTFVLKLSDQAISQYKLEKDIAAFLKKEMDKTYGTTWHCIVGKNFGSYVTHEMGNFIYFYVDALAILLFKTS